MKNLFFAILTSLSVISPNLQGVENAPKKILKMAEDKYQEITSFKADGKIVSKINMNNNKMELTSDFKIILAKPDLYKVTWSQNTGFMNRDGAVWNDGDGAFLYMGISKAYGKMENDEMALSSATGISNGAANTKPFLFFYKNRNILSTLSNCKTLKEEKIGDDECYVVEGDSPAATITVWISKSKKIILQVKKEMGKKPLPSQTMTDEQLGQALKSMKQESTPENIQKMRKTMEMAAKMSKNMKATFIETYSNVILNQKYPKEDFKFIPPADAVLKENLFQGLFSPNNSLQK